MTETGRLNPSGNAGTAGGQGGLAAFFARRWNGDVPLGQLFWRDMIVIGSAINIVATVLALVILAAKLPAPLAVAVHVLPLPYSLFLYGSVLRTTDMTETGNANAIKLGATAWIILASLL